VEWPHGNICAVLALFQLKPSAAIKAKPAKNFFSCEKENGVA